MLVFEALEVYVKVLILSLIISCLSFSGIDQMNIDQRNNEIFELDYFIAKDIFDYRIGKSFERYLSSLDEIHSDIIEVRSKVLHLIENSYPYSEIVKFFKAEMELVKRKFLSNRGTFFNLNTFKTYRSQGPNGRDLDTIVSDLFNICRSNFCILRLSKDFRDWFAFVEKINTQVSLNNFKDLSLYGAASQNQGYSFNAILAKEIFKHRQSINDKNHNIVNYNFDVLGNVYKSLENSKSLVKLVFYPGLRISNYVTNKVKASFEDLFNLSDFDFTFPRLDYFTVNKRGDSFKEKNIRFTVKYFDKRYRSLKLLMFEESEFKKVDVSYNANLNLEEIYSKFATQLPSHVLESVLKNKTIKRTNLFEEEIEGIKNILKEIENLKLEEGDQ